MIVKISRGAKVTGLMSYLAGPGKSNEHTDPHLVAGDYAIMAWHDDNELSGVDALAIGKQIDQPRKVFGTEIKIPNYLRDDAGQDVRDSHGKKVRDPIDPYRDGNVWHCSLSLKADEGELTDEQWNKIVTEFMDEMGFTDTSGRSPARWVAVRHGVSAKGNDHIHIAASAVREDGTKVNLYRDWKRASVAAARIEREHGLAVIESRQSKTGERGYHRAENARAVRNGQTELDRDLLARRVRACATSSKSEAEFVRRLRGQGLIVRPRFASGRDDVVVGYKVAVRPDRDATGTDAKPIFYGGGHLGKDLTLPRLRKEWEDTPTSSGEAVAEWRAARREKPAVRKGRESVVADPELLARAAQDIEQWNKYLTSIPVTDRAQWARAAGRTSGVFAAWSSQVEATPGPLARASVQLARSAQIPAHQHAPKKAGIVSAGGAAMIVMQCKPGLDAAAGYALLLRQLMKATEAIAASSRAAGAAAYAAQLETVSRVQLESVHRRLNAAAQRSAETGSVAVIERDEPAHEVTTTTPETAPESVERTYTAEEQAEIDAAQKSLRLSYPSRPTEAVRPSPLPPKLEPKPRTAAEPNRGRDTERDV